jgi:hypothetical protein
MCFCPRCAVGKRLHIHVQYVPFVRRSGCGARADRSSLDALFHMQAHASRAGIVHCKHNVVNEFDYQSDISRWHRVRRVPTFLVFVEGALIDTMMLPDSRGRASGPSRQVRAALLCLLPSHPA